MHLLYNSDSFAVMAFDLAPADVDGAAAGAELAAPVRGGFEIVDKFANKDVFLEGVVADAFKAGVQALVEQSASQPSQEDLDEYIGRYTILMQQPLVMH